MSCLYFKLKLKMSLQAIRAQINLLKNVAKANQAQQFFKTGPGQYGEGDIFIGLTNPQCRNIANNHKHINLKQIQELLQSKIHQERLIALVLMDLKYKNKKQNLREQIYNMYLRRMECVNNWDLVDLSAPNIVGHYILEKCIEFDEIKQKNDPRKILYQWVQSPNLWFRRVSIISTFTFIRANRYYDTLQLSKILLKDKEDLIHKAVGWMLREVGQRQKVHLHQFIVQNYENMPRTALRYAIQKFEQPIRKNILKGRLECISK